MLSSNQLIFLFFYLILTSSLAFLTFQYTPCTFNFDGPRLRGFLTTNSMCDDEVAVCVGLQALFDDMNQFYVRFVFIKKVCFQVVKHTCFVFDFYR